MNSQRGGVMPTVAPCSPAAAAANRQACGKVLCVTDDASERHVRPESGRDHGDSYSPAQSVILLVNSNHAPGISGISFDASRRRPRSDPRSGYRQILHSYKLD